MVLFVEDNQKQREYLLKCANKVNDELEIVGTGSLKEAIILAEEKNIEAFFIDIQLADGNGIDLAKQIRKLTKYQFTPIIFITAMLTKEMEAFHNIHCYDYIIKPYSSKTIEKVMKSILKDYLYNTNDISYIKLNYKGLIQQINTNDIYYIEKRNRKIIIVTKYEEISYKCMTLNEISKDLPNSFIQSHQSFLINRKFIKKLDLINNIIGLENCNDLIPIGVSFKRGVVKLVHGSI
jgi:two-component system LytT family response regulator